jgi:hypothetical protein
LNLFLKLDSQDNTAVGFHFASKVETPFFALLQERLRLAFFPRLEQKWVD